MINELPYSNDPWCRLSSRCQMVEQVTPSPVILAGRVDRVVVVGIGIHSHDEHGVGHSGAGAQPSLLGNAYYAFITQAGHRLAGDHHARNIATIAGGLDNG